MEGFILFFFAALVLLDKVWDKEHRRKQRRNYYSEYLKSKAWKRKRYVVLKRDNWRCRYCGAEATQVHHKRYARRNIGKEPIDWLVSVCKACHEQQHGLKGEMLDKTKINS